MITKRIVLLMVFCLSASTCIFGQQKEITREEYYQPFRAALKRASEISRRIVNRQENYRDGKFFSSEEYIDEYLKPDKRRYVHSEKFADRSEKIELIQIGEIYYCRRNDGEWKQSKSWCADGSASGLSNIVNSKFTVEETKLEKQKVKVYREYTTYKNIYSPDKDKEGLSYWQHYIWINDKGLVIYEEIENGLLEPSRLYRKQTEKYEYNPNIKIKAPILKKETK